MWHVLPMLKANAIKVHVIITVLIYFSKKKSTIMKKYYTEKNNSLAKTSLFQKMLLMLSNATVKQIFKKNYMSVSTPFCTCLKPFPEQEYNILIIPSSSRSSQMPKVNIIIIN